MFLRILLIFVVVGILFSARPRESPPRPEDLRMHAATRLDSERIAPPLTAEERARALRETVARWEEARALEEAEPPGACRRDHE